MEPKIIVNGVEYPLITEGDLTLGEAADAEKITGQGYDLGEGGALALLALAYVSIRRVDTRVELDDLRGLKGDDIQVVLPGGDAVIPPPESAGSSESEKPNETPSGPGSAETPEPTPEPSGEPS